MRTKVIKAGEGIRGRDYDALVEENEDLREALEWAVDVILGRAGYRGGFTHAEAADLLEREVSTPFANAVRSALGTGETDNE